MYILVLYCNQESYITHHHLYPCQYLLVLLQIAYLHIIDIVPTLLMKRCPYLQGYIIMAHCCEKWRPSATYVFGRGITCGDSLAIAAAGVLLVMVIGWVAPLLVTLMTSRWPSGSRIRAPEEWT